MKKYVVWLSENDNKGYVKESAGSTVLVEDPKDATAFPNRAVAMCVVSAVKPAIKKNKLSVQIGIECL